MNAIQRRKDILDELRRAECPLSATALAKQLSVSRQIIVGDIALLRAGGEEITATARGYVLGQPAGKRYKLACHHNLDQMRRELELMVDHGCIVEDVEVEHTVYGCITARLDLASRYDVDGFVLRVAKDSARPLSDLTDGIHIHTLRYSDEEAFQQLLELLRREGFLLE